MNEILKNAENYLHCDLSIDLSTKATAEKALDDICKNSNFRAIGRFLDIDENLYCSEYDFSLYSQDMKFYLEGMDKIFVMACTLGNEYERYSKRVQYGNMSYGFILDSVADAYLEYLADEYAEKNITNAHTFRICPGYGDIPLVINKYIARVLDIQKNIGINISDGGMLIPQKSMISVSGIGKNSRKEKSCIHCVRYEECSIRKENKRCYRTD